MVWQGIGGHIRDVGRVADGGTKMRTIFLCLESQEVPFRTHPEENHVVPTRMMSLYHSPHVIGLWIFVVLCVPSGPKWESLGPVLHLLYLCSALFLASSLLDFCFFFCKKILFYLLLFLINKKKKKSKYSKVWKILFHKSVTKFFIFIESNPLLICFIIKNDYINR